MPCKAFAACSRLTVGSQLAIPAAGDVSCPIPYHLPANFLASLEGSIDDNSAAATARANPPTCDHHIPPQRLVAHRASLRVLSPWSQ